MCTKESVLESTIGHWDKNFTGISAFAIAENLGCEHVLVQQFFIEFQDEGLGKVNENVQLYAQRIDGDKWIWSEIITSIFFPAPSVLSEHFYRSNLGHRNLPEFTARLHKGGSQVAHFYFSSEVLQRYLSHPEIYKVDDSIEGGSVRMQPDVYDHSLEHEQSEQTVANMRFGKRRLANGDIAVTAILWDLSQLPAAHQSYWHGYEIEKPTFTKNDPEFVRYFRRNFAAEWVGSEDPLHDMLSHVSQINSLWTDADFFRMSTNLHLAYPINNTYKNFCDCCSELYKLIGPDNLNTKLIKQLLSERYGLAGEDFIHNQSGRNLSTLQLLEKLLDCLSTQSLALELIKSIREHRTVADHKVAEPAKTNNNYLDDFRNLCSDLSRALSILCADLEALLNSAAGDH